jgi:hypothetical protein
MPVDIRFFAALASVVETCQRHGIDVRAYLPDILPKRFQLGCPPGQQVDTLGLARRQGERSGLK